MSQHEILDQIKDEVGLLQDLVSNQLESRKNSEQQIAEISKTLEDLVQKIEQSEKLIINSHKNLASFQSTISFLERRLAFSSESPSPWLRLNHWKGLSAIIFSVLLVQVVAILCVFSCDRFKLSDKSFNTYHFGELMMDVWPKLTAAEREKMNRLASGRKA